MEVLLILVIVIIIIAVVNSNINNDKPPNESSSAPTVPTPQARRAVGRPKPSPKPSLPGSTLQVSIRKKSIHIEGRDIDVFEYTTKGMFSQFRDIHLPEFIIAMHVNVNGKKLPVLSVLERWQAEDSNEFEMRQSLDDSLAAGSGSDEEVVIGVVPLDILGFPMSKACQVVATLKVNDRMGDKNVVTVKSSLSHYVSDHGYLESFQRETRLQGYMIKLALYMASTDGRTDDEEVDVIKRWGKRMVKALPEDHQAERMKHLNGALTEATNLIRAGSQAQLEREAVEVLSKGADVRELYDAYELCLMVIEADGEAHPEEMALLSRLSKGLGLDEDKARALLDKRVANLKFVFSDEGGSQDKHLGLTADMGKEDVRKHLGKLYRKHNARRSSNDEEIRNKAKEWLDMIAEARARHI